MFQAGRRTSTAAGDRHQAESEEDILVLVIANQDGHKVTMRVRPSTKIARMVDAYSTLVGLGRAHKAVRMWGLQC